MAAEGDWRQALSFQPLLLAIVALMGVAAVFSAISLWRRTRLALPNRLLEAIWVTLAVSWFWNIYRGI